MNCKCDVRIQAKFTEVTGRFCAKFGEVTPIVPDPYEGPYEVTPTWYEQELATRTRNMSDDVTVHKIPLYKTINPEGGNTVIIGG